MRTISLALLGALLLSACATAPKATNQQETRPNVVFILADDLGYGAIGPYGQKLVATPSLDRMASQGLRFTDFYAGSTVCAPSRAVLMTGQHTGHNTIRGNNSAVTLKDDEVTLAEIMRKAGYATGVIGKWGLGFTNTPGAPRKQGFDYFYGYLSQTHAHNYWPEYLYRNESKVQLENVVPNMAENGSGVASVKKQYSHDLIEAEALRFIDENKSRPFFLYMAVTLPHANNEARPNSLEVPDLKPYENKDWTPNNKAYAAMVGRLDASVGKVLDKLRALGLDENTIVIFTSDNGPHREGEYDPDFFDLNGPHRGIKRDLYDGGIRVPAIVRWPGKIKAGAVSDQVGYFADVLPTLAELVGQPVPSGVDGVSLLPTILNRGRQVQAPHLYWEFYEGTSAQAVRMGKWKGVRSPMITGAIELYDVKTDPGEATNLAEQHPDVVEQIRQILEKEHVPDPNWQPKKQAAAPAKKPAQIEYTGSCN